MNRVWIVCEGFYYEGWSAVTAFASEESARAYAAGYAARHFDFATVVESPVL